MKEVLDAKLCLQQSIIINSRSVWHYVIDTPIGMFNVVQYEQHDLAIKRFTYDGRNKDADNKYKQICNSMIYGKL